MNMSKITNKTRVQESGRKEKETAWVTAIGVQAADGLRTSEILWQIAQKNIDEKISIDEANDQIKGYYYERNALNASDPEKEDADKAAANIARILLTETLDFSAVGLAELHKEIFDGVYEKAGTIREIDVSKREWVLGGDYISFMNLEALPGSLDDCIEKERKYRYDTTSTDALISHLAAFISRIWQMCPFEEGNSRFTAVFTILYMRHLEIDFDYDTFKNDSYYLHNALVRANYRNIEKNIDYEPIYLERFFRNSLLSEQWDLRNRYVHVRPAAEWSTQAKLKNDKSTGQVHIKKKAREVKVSDKELLSIEEEPLNTIRPKTEITPIPVPENTEIAALEDKTDVIQASQEVNFLENPNILFIAVAIGDEFLSVKEIMERLHLKGRDSFLKLYLSPAIDNGIVSLLYPKSPRHPRQKYLLTQKGLDFLKSVGTEMKARVERHLANSRA